MLRFFNSQVGKIRLPLYFPDATRGVIKTLDSEDIKNTKTCGVLVNTYHLYKDLGLDYFHKIGGIRQFMNWDGALISDSGGFQVFSIAKNGRKQGSVNDRGVVFYPPNSPRILLTPEKSIQFQMALQVDLMVCLDDFTRPGASYKEAKENIRRTILWAKRSKKEYTRLCHNLNLKNRPAIVAVVQGGDYLDLRKECNQQLAEIGFDGYAYGGWPLNEKGKFNYEISECIAKISPKKSYLFGLGIGKPEEIVGCCEYGFNLFDCVLPTRDARHRRLYVYNFSSIDKIKLKKDNFYSFLSPDKSKYLKEDIPVSKACDCLLCRQYSRAYLAYLWQKKEHTAMRLSSIHNLRFYSLLMEKLQSTA